LTYTLSLLKAREQSLLKILYGAKDSIMPHLQEKEKEEARAELKLCREAIEEMK
jgi:hypothetical protein